MLLNEQSIFRLVVSRKCVSDVTCDLGYFEDKPGALEHFV